ncbi:hypothetical protein BD560DRAFT_413909 [Blakeslea trispora]|nr:hypothetical protein BD560DRAFT_413909 [Blakeslea trispora]
MSFFTKLPPQNDYGQFKVSDMLDHTFIQSELCFDQEQKPHKNLNLLSQSKDELSCAQQTDAVFSFQDGVSNDNVSSQWVKQESSEYNQDINFLFDYNDMSNTRSMKENCASVSTVNLGVFETKNPAALGLDSASSPSSSTATDDNNLFFYNHQQMNSTRCFSLVDSEIESLNQIGAGHLSQNCAYPPSPHSEHKSVQNTLFVDERNTYAPSLDDYPASTTKISMPTHYDSNYCAIWQNSIQPHQQTSTISKDVQSSCHSVPFASTKMATPDLHSYSEKNTRKRSIVDEILQDNICMLSIASSFSEPIPTVTTARHWTQSHEIQSSFGSPCKRSKSLQSSAVPPSIENAMYNTVSNVSQNCPSHLSTHPHHTSAKSDVLRTESPIGSLSRNHNNSSTSRISSTPKPEIENLSILDTSSANQYMLPSSHFLSDAMPRRQKLRYEGDYYTPKWVRFTGHLKEGYCDICHPGKWLQLKNSAYWYHKQFYHGISSVSGKPFMKPMEQRMGKGDVIEGLCHQCNRFVPACNGKKKNNYMLWYRHAHKVCGLFLFNVTVHTSKLYCCVFFIK